MRNTRARSDIKPRILVLCTNADQAGAPIHVETVISALSDRYDFSAVFGESGPVADRLATRGIDVRVIPEMRSTISLRQDVVAYRKLKKIIEQITPTALHCHSTKAGMLGRLVCANLRMPCLYTVHGWGWRGLGLFGAVAVLIIEKVLSAAPLTSYVYVSRSVEAEGRQLLGLGRNRGSVIYNGVTDQHVTYRAADGGRLKLLMAARVSSAKDHESLVRAFERASVPSELVLCGAGTDDPDFLSRVREWAPRKHALVACLGQRSDVRSLLTQIDVFALISNFEALPISIIEAMAAGRAVIATNVGGVSELVSHGCSGILVDKQDVESISAAIDSLDSADYRRRLGSAARSAYERHFTVAKMASALQGMYEQLVSHSARKA